MKLLRTILFAVDALLVTVLGLAAVVRNQAPEWFASQDLRLFARPAFLLAFGISAIVVHLAWVCAVLVAASERKRYITAGGGDTRVYVAIPAVEEALERSLKTLREVCRIKVRIEAGASSADAVSIDVYGVLWDDIDMTGATVRSRELVEQRYGEIVPNETEPKIRIHWEKLRPRHRHKLKPHKADDLPPFRGPQYPVSS